MKRRVARDQFERDDLVRTLRSYGVLTREGLLDRSRAGEWAEGNFEAALRLGVAEGSIRQLTDDLFEVGPDPPDPYSG